VDIHWDYLPLRMRNTYEKPCPKKQVVDDIGYISFLPNFFT